MADLFSTLSVGPFVAKNRVFMAPLTRCRGDAELVPTELVVRYYEQRASAGLIVSEASPISQQGVGYPNTPGLFTEKQVAGWKRVTAAVHAKGGLIYAQLWHTGRLSHPDFQAGGVLPVSASALNAGGEARTPAGMKPRVTPRALELHEIAGVIGQYREAARNALAAGFDGVELHGANGYLPDQFLRDGSNQRTDAYGGSLENRSRFMLEAAQALIEVWGAGRVGVRLSPSGLYQGMRDSDPRRTFSHVVRELGKLRVGYLHLMEKLGPLPAGTDASFDIPVSYFRPMYDGVIIANSGFTLERAQQYIREGWADAVAFGKLFIANPDLPERFKRMAAGEAVGMNEPDASTFYTPGEKGYVDYPALSAGLAPAGR